MRVFVDPDRCTGHGRCYSLAPSVFSSDDRGHCLIEVNEVRPEQEADARLGAANCPEGAIWIEE
ncbi:MAG: ferredoxin [Chloroflexota bacterium]